MTSLVNLFARVLVNGTNHLLKRGFDRGYYLHHEWTSRLRGRISFQEALRCKAALTISLPCDYDELSYNVLHNQILKATMLRLMKAAALNSELAEGLAHLSRRLLDVQDIELTSAVFSRVQLYRNNQFYDFLLKICSLIHDNLLVSEKVGESKFMDFVQDRRQMAIVFEDFVRNFYRTHTQFSVRREDIHWRWIPFDRLAADMLPKMQTDISLTSPDRKIIIDCKFTPEATQKHFEAEKLRSAHLYQVNAYLDNLLPSELTDCCEMILLYPTVMEKLSLSYKDQKGRKIRICTIDLNQSWPGIHLDLLALIA